MERLLVALEQQAEEAPTQEERSRARRMADALRNIGLDVLTNAAGSALGGMAG